MRRHAELAQGLVMFEQGIGSMKRLGIAAQRWRNPRPTRTIIMKNVAGLANWANG
jgi:hypothetical protein